MCVYGRSEQPAERLTQTADEGPVCRTMSDSSRQTQFAAAVSADAHGSSRLSSQRLTDTYQPGSHDLLLSLQPRTTKSATTTTTTTLAGSPLGLPPLLVPDITPLQAAKDWKGKRCHSC